MAQLAIAAVGAAVFGAAGGTLAAAQLGWTLFSIAGGLLMGGGPRASGPRLEDLKVQTSTLGTAIPSVYGAVRLAGNIIWAQDIKEHKKAVGGGILGKGGGGGTTFSYTLNFAVAFCEGPLASIQRLWANGKLIYDGRPGALRPKKYKTPIRFYLGDETQLPDPLIETDKGVGQVPAFRGLAYVVFENLPLADFGSTAPNITAECVKVTSPGALSVVQALATNASYLTIDPVNPVLYIFRGDRTYKIDSITNAILVQRDGEIPLSSQGVAVVARNGDIVAPVVVNFPIDQLARYSAQMLEPYAFGPSTFTRLGALYVDRLSANERFWGVTDGIAQAGDVLIFDGGLLLTVTLGRDATFGGRVLSSLTFDTDGNAWGVGRLDHIGFPLPPATLYKMTPTGVVSSWSLAADLPYAQDLTYDPNTASLFISSGNTVKQWDIASASVTHTIAFTSLAPYASYSFKQGVSGTSLWLPGDYNGVIGFHEINVLTGTVVRSVRAADGAAVTGPQDLYTGIYDPHANAIWTYNFYDRATYKFSLPMPVAAAQSLQAVVEDLCAKAGLDIPTQVDATALASDVVHGYVLNHRAPLRSFLEPLTTAYFFDGVESDAKLKWIKRGGAPLLIIPEADMAAHADGEARPFATLLERRQQEIELPERIDVRYWNEARDYQEANQHAKRLLRNIHTKDPESVELPLVFSDDEAKRIAERLLYLVWIDRNTVEFTLPYGYLKLDPADIVVLAMDSGATFKVRFTKIELGANLVLSCQATAEDSVVYVSAANGANTSIIPHQILVPGQSVLFLLDTPMLRDADNDPGFYLAATPALGTADTDWRGALVYRAPDNATWEEEDFLPNPATMGRALTVLPATDRWTVWDEQSTVRVKLYDGQLSNATALQVLNYANAAVIGDEIVQFRTATPVGPATDMTYELSGLLRARRGTEWAVGTHAVGDKFVLLNQSGVDRLRPDLGEVGLQRFYRGVSIGEPFDEATTQAFTNTARGLKPYSPGHITGVRDMSGNLTISWVRRTRVGGDWLDSVEVPLSEASEAYSLDIYNGSAVVRTLTSSTQSAAYSVADQITDFGAPQPQGAVRLTAYQISQTVGRGFGRTATV